MTAELTSADYEYALPDHWVLHSKDADSPFAKLHRFYVGRVVEIVRESGAQTVLEAGCGDGWNVAQFVNAGMQAAGCDWSKNAIQYAKINCPKAEFYCGDVRDEEFRSQFRTQFDAVALIEVIEHIPPKDTVEALRNLLDRLKPGGTFVLTTPHSNFPNTNQQHYRHFTTELLTSIMNEVGEMEITAFESYGDTRKDQAYWSKMRWFDNRLFTIKPLAKRLIDQHNYVRSNDWERAHGIIMTARKTS